MSTPNWTLFAGAVLLATVVLLYLSRASARMLSAADSHDDRGVRGGPHVREDGSVPVADSAPTVEETRGRSPPSIPTGGALLANVALTHGLLGAGLLGLVWYASIPPSAVGIGTPTGRSVAIGVAIGVGLYLASEAGTAVAARLGIEYDERLRERLAPTRPIEWAALLLVILPLIAGAEELLFRGILIGAIAAGFGLPPWMLAVASSVLFGLAHSAQGGVGVAVTAALGLVLAAAFVWTGSLAVVVLAHYTVDALEFVIREGVLD